MMFLPINGRSPRRLLSLNEREMKYRTPAAQDQGVADHELWYSDRTGGDWNSETQSRTVSKDAGAGSVDFGLL